MRIARVVVNCGNASGGGQGGGKRVPLYVVGGAPYAYMYVRPRYFLAEIRSTPLKIAHAHHRAIIPTSESIPEVTKNLR